MRPANSVVAVVDDEENIRETVAFALRREGFPVELYATGLEAWRAFQQKLPGLVILDIVMPEMDGLELCRKVRGVSETLPIIFLTSRDEELDRVLGLEIGADDYLCQPFSMRELLARVKAFIRRMKRLLRPFTRLTFRLLAFNLILVFFPIAGVLFLGQYEQRLETAETRDLTHRARLIAAAIAREGTLDPDAFEDVIHRSKIEDMRVRLIDSRGRVVGDSHDVIAPVPQRPPRTDRQ